VCSHPADLTGYTVTTPAGGLNVATNFSVSAVCDTDYEATLTPASTAAVWTPGSCDVTLDGDVNQNNCEAMAGTWTAGFCNDAGATSPADQAACEALYSDTATASSSSAQLVFGSFVCGHPEV
jgi:hypothetical protein